MRKIFLSSVLVALAMFSTVSATFAYPERPESWRVQYEMYYLPMRLISMISAVVWDVPTGAFQDGLKGAIGGSKAVARSVNDENGTAALAFGGLTGGPVGLVSGAAYGLLHGFGYGSYHGFMGYPSAHNGSYRQIFQGREYVVPYNENY